MKQKIQQYLQQLEETHNIKILLAVETGSRSWGFASPDSDYDVRLIYVHDQSWYLQLFEGKDALSEFYEGGEIDITGWELRKALRLMKKSNAALLERLQSKIIYKADPVFLEEMQLLANKAYGRIACIHHYGSLANNFLNSFKEGEPYKLKSFFYALRSSLICRWILDKETIPPIAFEEVYQALNLEESLVERIEALIHLKSTVDESYLHNGEQELFDLMHTCLQRMDAERQTLPGGEVKVDELSVLLTKYIDTNHDN